MILQRFEVPGLAHFSYLVASQGEAIVIDPQRDISVYQTFAASKGLRILHVLETHIHADYVSGALALSSQTGALLWLSGYDQGEQYQSSMPHSPLQDGDQVPFGSMRVVAVHTPGHTPEHISYLLYEQSGCGHPLALFSGDFLLVGSLGRPDLLGEEAKQRLAAQLYRSVHTRIASLPDGTLVCPAHGAGSLCGVGISERAESTIGYERQCNVFMTTHSEKSFIHEVLSTVPQFPGYYKRMKAVNAEGAPPLSPDAHARALSASAFCNAIANEQALVLDVRSPEAFGGAHIQGAINIGAGANLSLWAGWVLPYDADIFLVGDEPSGAIAEVERSLWRVGHKRIAGYLEGGLQSWIAAGFPQAHLPQTSVHELKEASRMGAAVLDVRSPAEWKAGHIAGAKHIPLGELPQRPSELDPSAPLHVICGSGYRSSIGCSLLQRAGFAHVHNTLGGMGAWHAQGFAVVTQEAAKG